MFRLRDSRNNFHVDFSQNFPTRRRALRLFVLREFLKESAECYLSGRRTRERRGIVGAEMASERTRKFSGKNKRALGHGERIQEERGWALFDVRADTIKARS